MFVGYVQINYLFTLPAVTQLQCPVMPTSGIYYENRVCTVLCFFSMTCVELTRKCSSVRPGKIIILKSGIGNAEL
jgi:hypothetical protein